MVAKARALGQSRLSKRSETASKAFGSLPSWGAILLLVDLLLVHVIYPGADGTVGRFRDVHMPTSQSAQAWPNWTDTSNSGGRRYAFFRRYKTSVGGAK